MLSKFQFLKNKIVVFYTIHYVLNLLCIAHKIKNPDNKAATGVFRKLEN